jgi:sialate O-acetylesterase
MKNLAALALLLLFFDLALADVSLPKIFGDNMVLQRNQPIPVWGWAKPGEKISVQFDKQSKMTKTGANGKWMLMLDPETAGGPYQMTVKGKNVFLISNILVGEVWICSGQSNMEMPIEGWGKINDYKNEIANADYPQIRHIKVPNSLSATPKEDIAGGEWQVCSPKTAGDFTATGYFFARELYNKLHIPIGLINTSWGGTMIETWISKAAFEQDDYFKKMIDSMSTLDLAVQAKQKKEAMMKKIALLQGVFDENANVEKWKNTDFEDSDWPHMKLPGYWENQGMGLEDLDGLVWFRKTVLIEDADAGKPATLDLSKIDDSDQTYLNGVKVGETLNKYSELRHYNIPAGLLKPGKNVIAVRVEDTGGGGGIYGEPGEMKLMIGIKLISLAGDWSFKIQTVFQSATGIGPNSYPTLLFNAMIKPLIPFGIKGAIWYQGEANAGRAYEYRKSFPLMINDWRSQWGEGKFPFYFVQLASFNAGDGNSERGSEWAELREAQTMTLSLPNTGMAVTTDIGLSNDIHPKNKQDVGKRLGDIALSNLYSSTAEYSGPILQAFKIDGNKMFISFTHAANGLIAKDKYGYLKGFEIAGSDRHFHYAKAYIDGDKVVVYADDVNSPVTVRYAWADDALDANLYNKDGFPASSFRTDDWKTKTADAKYHLGE